MKKFAIYIKFYVGKVHKIQENWDHILTNINYDDTNVYIWIYDENSTNLLVCNETVKDCMKKYSKAIFVTNYNQNNYLSDEDQKYLRIFPSNKSMELRQYAICESHLKAFLIPRNCEYIFKLDGDDMFYPNFKIEYFYKIVDYMKKHKLKIITRPFWMWRQHGWSFGFTVAESNILNYIKPEQIKGMGWENLDRFKVYNLDNLLGYILIILYKIPINKLFFKLKDYKWSFDRGNPHNEALYGNTEKSPEDNYIDKINGIII